MFGWFIYGLKKTVNLFPSRHSICSTPRNSTLCQRVCHCSCILLYVRLVCSGGRWMSSAVQPWSQRPSSWGSSSCRTQATAAVIIPAVTVSCHTSCYSQLSFKLLQSAVMQAVMPAVHQLLQSAVIQAVIVYCQTSCRTSCHVSCHTIRPASSCYSFPISCNLKFSQHLSYQLSYKQLTNRTSCHMYSCCLCKLYYQQNSWHNSIKHLYSISCRIKISKHGHYLPATI